MSKIIQNIVPPVVYKTVTRDYGFSSARIPSLKGKTIVLTGGTGGIGLAAARAFYAHSARLIILSSTKKNADDAIKYIESGDLDLAPSSFRDGFGSSKPNDKESAMQKEGGETGKGEIVWKKCRLEHLEEVRKVADEIVKEEGRLDLFLGVAGIGVNEFVAGDGGYDQHLLINNLSHILLANRLLPLMRKTTKLSGSDVRLVLMSSELHRATLGGPGPVFGGSKFSNKDEFKEDIGPSNLYARTKLATLLTTKALVGKTSLGQEKTKIAVFATHPGAVSTGQQDQFKPAYGDTIGSVLGAAVSWAMRNPDEGAMSLTWASTSPEAIDKSKYSQGSYFTDPNELGKESSESSDPELIDNFWKTSQEVIQEIAGEDALIGWDEGL